MSDEWPPYRVGKPEYLHALGVIASVFLPGSAACGLIQESAWRAILS
jgi:hypothetical protein